MYIFIHMQKPLRQPWIFLLSVFTALFFFSLPPLDLSVTLCLSLLTFHYTPLLFLLSASLSLTHTLSLSVSPGWSPAWLCVIVYLHLLSLSEDRVHNPTEGQRLTGSLASSAEITALYCFFSLVATLGLAIVQVYYILASGTYVISTKPQTWKLLKCIYARSVTYVKWYLSTITTRKRQMTKKISHYTLNLKVCKCCH